MKLYILFIGLVVAIAQVQATILEEAVQTDQKCRDASKISQQDITELLNLKVTQPAKCYLKCFLESEGFWQNKQLNKKYILEVLSKFGPLSKFRIPVSGVLDQCQNVQAGDDCEAAFAAVECVTITAIKTVGGIIGKILFMG